jgi:hypothetical protein
MVFICSLKAWEYCILIGIVAIGCHHIESARFLYYNMGGAYCFVGKIVNFYILNANISNTSLCHGIFKWFGGPNHLVFKHFTL